jgi:type I restriction enzyme R subunit
VDGFEGKVQFVWQVADLLRDDYRTADNGGEQFSLTVKEDDIAGALFSDQENSNKLLKALLENENFADVVHKVISRETWKAARRKHDERSA